ncbi:MAG: hypothetical protein JF595_14150, partial [Sphingomonadales bacterium]|nr:hypothetical protein [Sphingomonadales bacterium]
MALLRSVMLLPLALGVLAAACSNKAEQAPTGLASEAVPTPTVDASSQAPSAAAGVARHEKLSNAEFEFDYSYPAAAGAIPALKALLDADIAKQKAALAASAKEQRAESKKEGFDYNPLGNWVEWKVVTDLPGW